MLSLIVCDFKIVDPIAILLIAPNLTINNMKEMVQYRSDNDVFLSVVVDFLFSNKMKVSLPTESKHCTTDEEVCEPQ